MWEPACERLVPSVHVVVSAYEFQQGGRDLQLAPWPRGTCFLINDGNQFLTNAHVALVEEGKPAPELGVAVFTPDPPNVDYYAAHVSAEVPELDLALLETPETGHASPAVFAEDELLPMGRPIASLGFPLPYPVDSDDESVSVRITRRLATGHVSSPGETAATLESYPRREQYELSMFCYPGNSGGPCFDVEGRVTAVSRGTRMEGGSTAGYAYAIRNREIHHWLDQIGAEFTVDG